jgi:hypothetical protein
MKIKLLPLLLSICFVYSQSEVDSAGSNFENIKTDLDKLNNNVTTLDSLLKTKSSQSLTDKKFKQIDKSLSDINEELSSKVNSINSSLDQLKDDLTNNINTISDSLLTTANNILRMKEQNSFNEAFDKARINLGPNQKFEWNGKTYTTDYEDEETASPTIVAIRKIDKKIVEMNAVIDKAESQIVTLDMLGKDSKSKIQNLNKTITDRTLYWIIAILIVLIIVISIFLVLKSKVAEQKDSLSLVKGAQEKLENESIQLDEKLIQVLEQKLEAANLQSQAVDEADHSLPLTMGNEIHRMRNRLKTMDESSHAVKVLNNRLEKLEEVIKDKGYEIIDLKGKPFNDGMTVQARFVPDSNLKDGESIITRVIKPQINFKEKLIQAAEVEVSQG